MRLKSTCHTSRRFKRVAASPFARIHWLRGNFGSVTCEYSVEEGADPVVSVVAIGRKEGNTVYIGGEAVQL